MSRREGSSAIVVGAGMAGLVTARVLSDHVDRVRILERDRLPEDAIPRSGVPQGRHAHILLAAGQWVLDGWFPGLADELRAEGAVPLDSGGLVWRQGGASWTASDLGLCALSMSRPLLETTVRRRLLRQRPNVSVADETAVDGLLLEDGRVVGVQVDGARHRADLVVACSGRHTRFLDLLAERGFPAPEMSAVRIDLACGTRVVPRQPDDLTRAVAIEVDDPAQSHRMGRMVPAEGNRWIITLGSFHDDAPPIEPAAYEDFARCLPSPLIADVLARTEALTPVLTYRMPTSRRRHVERLDRTPAGFLVLGDAICSLNPLHAQGMSSAALQAQALGRAIARHGLTSPQLARAFYRQAAKVVDAPWRLAAAADFADPCADGPESVGTGLLNRYLDMVLRACRTSIPVARQTLRVQNLLARLASLMTPAMVVRVLLAARRSPAAATNPADREAGSPVG
ncbi:FAD-dependent oxidoreductase [Acrocarpospora corrugata]|uniref:FAD-dependent oxidoreductase n=1 Tax=Acrocarpospora corrugata TaxID=35763 RepID=UPI0012D2C0F1|nr:FAD-dependent monooxygenase [Acrocarpospora corrugata]